MVPVAQAASQKVCADEVEPLSTKNFAFHCNAVWVGVLAGSVGSDVRSEVQSVKISAAKLGRNFCADHDRERKTTHVPRWRGGANYFITSDISIGPIVRSLLLIEHSNLFEFLDSNANHK